MSAEHVLKMGLFYKVYNVNVSTGLPPLLGKIKKKVCEESKKKKKKLETWFLQWNENANVLFMEK